jgi:hypothetical protein
MPYALIPDDYKLKKVTKLEEKGVNSKRRHDNVEALLSNPNTPLVIGGMITAFFGVKLAEDVIADLENRLGALSEDVKQGIRDTVYKPPVITTPGGTPFRPPSISLEDLLKAIIPGGD